MSEVRSEVRMSKHIFLWSVICALGGCVSSGPARVDSNGSIHVPAFVLPDSSLLDEATISSLRGIRDYGALSRYLRAQCPALEEPAIQVCMVRVFRESAFYQDVRRRYPVRIEEQTLGGVHVEIFSPEEGVTERNQNRVLINLHAGGFWGGWGTYSQLESLPIAAVGRLRVVSVDYRHAPDHRFPAASKDVASVYRELLKQYPPRNIGIYGCSAGGLLTAESVAWLASEALPLPGAIGMFGAGAAYWMEGDSARLNIAIGGGAVHSAASNPYFGESTLADPLAFPVHSGETLSRFPPSLLISSTRDISLSSVVYTHSALTRLGRESDLHVWEGMGHCFLALPLPPSEEANDVIVRFFDRHLGK